MSDNVYFDGDPATDSARRHMERVLKSPAPARRWPWVVAALGGAGAWLLWRAGRAVSSPAKVHDDDDQLGRQVHVGDRARKQRPG